MRITTNGVELHVTVAGDGPPILLVHGWPHTWQVWEAVLEPLAREHRVIAPDLRGIGASERPGGGYDARTIAADLRGLLDALDAPMAQVMAIDAGVPAAFLLALETPERVRALVLMESLLGRLPGAEEFLAGGPPWWFGFHAVPGLAERVLAGHESDYLDFFLQAGTHDRQGVPAAQREAFVDAYASPDAMTAGFGFYRALAESAAQIADAVDGSRLTVPTLAVGADAVGDALARQLAPISDRLDTAIIPDCGHVIPLDRPAALLELLRVWN